MFELSFPEMTLPRTTGPAVINVLPEYDTRTPIRDVAQIPHAGGISANVVRFDEVRDVRRGDAQDMDAMIVVSGNDVSAKRVADRVLK